MGYGPWLWRNLSFNFTAHNIKKMYNDNYYTTVTSPNYDHCPRVQWRVLQFSNQPIGISLSIEQCQLKVSVHFSMKMVIATIVKSLLQRFGTLCLNAGVMHDNDHASVLVGDIPGDASSRLTKL